MTGLGALLPGPFFERGAGDPAPFRHPRDDGKAHAGHQAARVQDEQRLVERADLANVLADRLKRLVAAGLLTKVDDMTHWQKAIYSLAEPAIHLMPPLAQMGAWDRRHTPASEPPSARARLLEKGGPAMWQAFMDELRHVHLGTPPPGRSVVAELQAASEAAVQVHDGPMLQATSGLIMNSAPQSLTCCPCGGGVAVSGGELAGFPR